MSGINLNPRIFTIFQLDQLVLALPSQDYYLKASSEGDLQAYHKYMVSIAVLLGANETTADRELQDVVKFEMQLANVIEFPSSYIRLLLSTYSYHSFISLSRIYRRPPFLRRIGTTPAPYIKN